MNDTTTMRHLYTRREITDGTGWASDVRFVPVLPGVMAHAMTAAQEAQDAAYGDSNDDEIELLRNALEFALAALGLSLPAPTYDGE